jgi:hypothetical protein
MRRSPLVSRRSTAGGERSAPGLRLIEGVRTSKETRPMKNVIAVAFITLLAAASMQPAGALGAASLATDAAGTVKLTITYKGKSKVDASHKLWVYLFDTPNIGPGAMPIDMIALDKNGADAVFENIAGDKVYVAVALDENGTMSGDAPPPTGSPVGVLSGPDGTPRAITPGATDPVALNFDDTIRMP